MPQEPDNVSDRLRSAAVDALASSAQWLAEALKGFTQDPDQLSGGSLMLRIQNASNRETQRFDELLSPAAQGDNLKLGQAPLEKHLAILGLLLSSKFPDVRRLALNTLLSMSIEQAREKVFLALDDPDEQLQLLATKELVSCRSRQKLRLLAKQLRSPFEAVRNLALSEISRESLRCFVRAHRGLDEDVKKLAASAVMKMKSDELAAELEREFDGATPEERIELLLASKAFAGKKEVSQLIAKLLNSPDKRIRATAVPALAAVSGPASLELLEPLLKDPDPRVRANATEVVAELKGEQAKQALLALLSDENNRVRGNAAKALWQMGETKARDAVTDMLKSKDPLMRMSALWVLGEILPEDVADGVGSFAERDPDPRVRKRANITLQKLKSKKDTDGQNRN